MANTRPTPPPTGCLIDGHHGQYIYASIVGLASVYGYKPSVTFHAEVQRQRVADESRHGIQATEEVIEESELAINWLNEHVAERDYAFGWWEGEFFYMPAEWWEEDT